MTVRSELRPYREPEGYRQLIILHPHPDNNFYIHGNVAFYGNFINTVAYSKQDVVSTSKLPIVSVEED